MQSAELSGFFLVACVRPDGSTAWSERVRNGVTTAGLTDLLAAGFCSGTQRTWKLGLISSSGYGAVSAADTMPSHPGWSEFTGYSGSRPAWSPSAGSAVAAGPAAAFPVTGDGAARGLFVTSDATKGGSSGVLWSTALFGTARTLRAGQTLNVSYVLRAAGGAG
jgi:hypothetical protein